MADESPTSKKLLEKQQRRAAEEARRREQQKIARKRNLVTLGIAVVVLAVVVALVLQNRDGGSSVAATVGEKEAGCTPIEEHEIEGQKHVDVTPEYGTNPPTSGDHLQTPAAAGFFEEPVDPGALVHNMEHGQIIFWYDTDAPESVLDSIEAMVDDQPSATVAVPWDEIEAPHTFAMTAWGASQSCRQVSQDVVAEFRTEYQGKGPEVIPGIDTYQAD